MEIGTTRETKDQLVSRVKQVLERYLLGDPGPTRIEKDPIWGRIAAEYIISRSLVIAAVDPLELAQRVDPKLFRLVTVPEGWANRADWALGVYLTFGNGSMPEKVSRILETASSMIPE
ncbi:MAG: hypothetical protein UY26_C0003G0066 [Candidatus Jorgensenbacteria bacterium GW2011_GWA1_48_13]|uniref:Uncharacterized protein n=2 Tax=Candidatus Joergenseniibacteriota TaxID=1752739 RepID=A0A0G1YJ64_9BACT|nr:MAG: hypothetical protein UY26_C0003G0066 [Candidatus Jorgensenbacteria bacterium GW2011_GWA1_48_13]KKU99343.1 MAG: hypothetical protein UY32_C0002G0079 [Candidatus Jorgensenbacteria bacterium GW2011_GWC1_48_8]KKW15027.1 MAG: hypothetical protein UY55_C0002G0083 [Candidatus Jorgensenbacteria bacterium GW2011_GWB1_50_10]